MLCKGDKIQRVRFNLKDAESSSQQNNLSPTTFSPRTGGDRMTGSEIQIRKGQFYHTYVRQRQKKADNQPKQNTENKSTNCQKAYVLITQRMWLKGDGKHLSFLKLP